MAERGSRSLLAPVIGGLVLIVAIVAGIAFRSQLWAFLKWLGRTTSDWLTNWVPDHPAQAAAIGGFAVLCLAINWLAHVRGRLRAWIFALVVEAGLWVLFWYGPGIPPLNDLFGLHIDPPMTSSAVALSTVIVIGVTGVVFWFLELREEWNKYRRSTHVDDD